MWSDTRPVWTGSCPCQPYSAAGKGKGAADERDLWPVWFRLIRECRPATVFGEQVSSAIAHGWLDRLAHDLEGEGYAIGSAEIPACGAGAFHKRERLWFVANADTGRRGSVITGGNDLYRDNTGGLKTNGLSREANQNDGVMGYANTEWQPQQGGAFGKSGRWFGDTSASRDVAYDESQRCERRNDVTKQTGGSAWATSCTLAYAISQRGCSGNSDGKNAENADTSSERNGAIQWLDCPDGKARPVMPGVRLLANGFPERIPLLRAAGNAIDPRPAAEFIKAAKECLA